MDNIVIASIILIVLFGLVFRRQGYEIGRFIVIVLYVLIGFSFEALALGLFLQGMKSGESLTQGFFFIISIALGVVGIKFLKDIRLS